MLNQPAEYFLQLHAAEQSRFFAEAERRRNAERRRAGTADPLRPRPALAVLIEQAGRLTSFVPLRTAPAVPCENCP
ncbi:hypothetical protein D6T65_02450 [Arthrobacter frigidicola]|nr:hypothetical protein D6T65_02450 [Arthrobacter frigidicola]